MPKIPSYPLAEAISNEDLLVMDDASAQYATKSLELQLLKGFINTGQATTTYVADQVVTGASFNTNTGVLTLTRNGGEIPSVTTNLDGRYYLSSKITATSNYIPKLDATSSLVNSVIYQDGDGHVGIGVPGLPPNPRHKFEVYDLRDENNAFDYSMIVTSDINSPFNQGAGGIKNQLSLDGGTTYPYAISLVAGSNSSDLMATTKLAFYSNSDLNTSSATGFSGFAVHDGSNPFWQLGGGALDPTPTTTLKVVGTGEFTGQVTIPQTPINPTDAASKAYVDLQSGGGGGGVTEITTTAPITGGPITTAGSIGISQASTSGDGYISSADWNTFNNKQSTSEKGAASGYAPLDANQKVPSANLPDSLVGAVVYQSTWNAGTDTPTLPTPAAGNNGHYYIVSDPGTYLGITYAVGDWIISNGIAWEKVDNTQDVNSVFGRQGNVVANANDYAAFYDANVQSNWNETNSGSDAFILNKPTIPPAYTNADVDAHLNTDTATASQVLSWTGSDYDWVAQSGGGGGVTSIIAGTGISILPGNGLGDVQITNTLALQSAYDTSSFFSGSGGVDSLASLFNGNASDKRILLPYPDTDKLWVVLDLIAYLDTSGGTYTADGDLYVGPDVTIPSEGIGIKIPSTFLNSTTSKVIGIRCAMDYEVAENDIKGKDFVLKAFSTPVSISSTGATLKISYTRRLLTNLFD